MKRVSSLGLFLAISLVPLTLVGCAEDDTASDSQAAAPTAETPSAGGAKLLLEAEPEGGADVIAVRETAVDAEPVVIVGRIGGSENPWVEGLAAFTIVDPSLKACSDIEGDDCSTPWDYCCATDQLPGATAVVKFVDADGKIIQEDARKLLGLTELQTVVVRGAAERDDEGNLTILADGLFVRK